MAGRLTARKVATAKPGKYSDGGNLYLIVSPKRLPQMGPPLHVAGQSKRNGTWDPCHGVPCRRPREGRHARAGRSPKA